MITTSKQYTDIMEYYKDAEAVWGRDVGYCAWCVHREVGSPTIWEYATDSQDQKVKYACCDKCAKDREVTT